MVACGCGVTRNVPRIVPGIVPRNVPRNVPRISPRIVPRIVPRILPVYRPVTVTRNFLFTFHHKISGHGLRAIPEVIPETPVMHSPKHAIN